MMSKQSDTEALRERIIALERRVADLAKAAAARPAEPQGEPDAWLVEGKGTGKFEGKWFPLTIHGCKPAKLGEHQRAIPLYRHPTAQGVPVGVVRELVDASEDLRDLMAAVREGEYEPDSFTTQPVEEALSILRPHLEQGGEG